MLIAGLLEAAAPLLTVLTPLVAVPLTVITFYLRSLREHQVTWHAELVRRIEAAEAGLAQTRGTLAQFERDYTSKEEWLRECMHARRVLEQVTAATVRLETTLHNLLDTPDPAERSEHRPPLTAPTPQGLTLRTYEPDGARK